MRMTLAATALAAFAMLASPSVAQERSPLRDGGQITPTRGYVTTTDQNRGTPIQLVNHWHGRHRHYHRPYTYYRPYYRGHYHYPSYRTYRYYGSPHYRSYSYPHWGRHGGYYGGGLYYNRPGFGFRFSF